MNKAPVSNNNGEACTTEAKLCPDGSAVARTGPNCEFEPCQVASATTTSSTIGIGTSVTINGTVIHVRSLVEDSRCPVDVQCIQAGTVRVRAVINASSDDLTFTLSQPQVVGEKTITLVSVIPALKYSAQAPQPSDYRFTFTVASTVPRVPPVSSGGGRVCTMDAQRCADGSYVSRTGPKCEFAPCPGGDPSI